MLLSVTINSYSAYTTRRLSSHSDIFMTSQGEVKNKRILVSRGNSDLTPPQSNGCHCHMTDVHLDRQASGKYCFRCLLAAICHYQEHCGERPIMTNDNQSKEDCYETEEENMFNEVTGDSPRMPNLILTIAHMQTHY